MAYLMNLKKERDLNLKDNFIKISNNKKQIQIKLKLESYSKRYF